MHSKSPEHGTEKVRSPIEVTEDDRTTATNLVRASMKEVGVAFHRPEQLEERIALALAETRLMNEVRSPVEDQRDAFLLLKNAVDKLGEAILKLNKNQQVMLTAIGNVNADIGELRQKVYQLDKKQETGEDFSGLFDTLNKERGKE